MMFKFNRKLLSIFILLGFLPMNLFAYIDPGSGGALITAILGFFAAIIYSFKKFFYNLRSKFQSKKHKS
jgi:hypothetical protein